MVTIIAYVISGVFLLLNVERQWKERGMIQQHGMCLDLYLAFGLV